MSEAEEFSNEDQDYKYWAFISYSHHDDAWAKWLHKSLETYSVPRGLVGRHTSKHGDIPKRVFPVFRDREELPGAADLSAKIKHALSKSRNLIVICSPKSSTSKWVNEEIKTYKAMGRDDRVLCLIINGEPNASDHPERGLQECFPEAVRFRVDPSGQISSVRAEPLAADVRKGKDGKFDANLKLLSGVLDVGYDELRQREKRRKLHRQIRNLGVSAVLSLFTFLGYLAIADAGLGVPGRDRIQTLLDHNDISVMRRAHSFKEIRDHASPLRRTLVDALEKIRNSDGWIESSFNPKQEHWVEIWAHSQSLCGILKTPEVDNEEARTFVNALELPFTSGMTVEKDGVKFGWQSHKKFAPAGRRAPEETETIAEPAYWTAAALVSALSRPGLLTEVERHRFEGRFFYTQEVLKLYRPLDDGGWNMFPKQKELELHNPYTSALALFALLETRKAGLPWDGSTERRDQLLRATAQWLINKFDDDVEGKDPGWHGVSESANQIYDGLTLQIYAELLRAEAEAGIELPPAILKQIPLHLMKTVDRDFDFPVASGEFSASMTDHTGRQTMGKESIGFLWYPWAIDASTRWLERAEKHGAPQEERVRVRRALGHLVIDLGKEAVIKASTDWTFIAAELLNGLSNIPQPD